MSDDLDYLHLLKYIQKMVSFAIFKYKTVVIIILNTQDVPNHQSLTSIWIKPKFLHLLEYLIKQTINVVDMSIPHYFTAMKIKPEKPLHILMIMLSITNTHDRCTEMAYIDATRIYFIITSHDEVTQIEVSW